MKTIVFDFDGTLVNTMERVFKLYNEVIVPRFHCRAVSVSDLVRLRNGRPQDFLREFGISYWKLPLILWVVRRKLKESIDQIELQPGMREALIELRSGGVQNGILTSNSKRNVEAFLERQGLTGTFAFIQSHRSIFGKHGPLRKMKKAIGDLTYVGDEVRDVEAAKRAGVRSVAVAWGFQTETALKSASPDFLLTQPGELTVL